MKDIVDGLVKRINENLDRQDKIRTELSSFNKGHLITKRRNGIGYYYLEYRENDKVKTDYIGKVSDVDITKYLLEKDKKMKLKNELCCLIDEENKIKSILKKLDIKNYRTVYTLYEIKKILKPYLKKYNIEKAYIFGSYAKNLATKKSDLDFVFTKPKKSKVDEFEEAIKRAFGKDIDFVYSGETMQKQFIEKIRSEMVSVID